MAFSGEGDFSHEFPWASGPQTPFFQKFIQSWFPKISGAIDPGGWICALSTARECFWHEFTVLFFGEFVNPGLYKK
jgi:hypothetical protein